MVDAETFRRACGKFATGIAIVTARGTDGQPHGLTVNSFTSVSLTPPLVLVCLDRECNLLLHFLPMGNFAIHLLRHDQEDISIRFAEWETGRFTGLDWKEGLAGVPVLAHALATLQCRTRELIEAGDHIILIGEVLQADYSEGLPLLYFSGAYQRLE